MSWFLGAIRIDPRVSTWESTLAVRFKSVQEKYSSEVRWVQLEAEGLCLLKASVGAFNDLGIWREDSAISTLAGELLLPRTLSTPLQSRRTLEAELLVKSLTENRQKDLLKSSRGTFACAAYDSKIGKLLLATDKLGVRPVYYLRDRDSVYFGTSLRDLLSVLPHRPPTTEPAFRVSKSFDLDLRCLSRKRAGSARSLSTMTCAEKLPRINQLLLTQARLSRRL